MTFSPQTLTLLVVLALAVGVAALLLVASGGSRRRTGSAADLSPEERTVATLEEHARAIGQLRATVKRLASMDAQLQRVLAGAVQRVGLVRYDAFDDMGGRLSFSLALLDASGDGVVVTSINGRQDTRVYAKPVRRGVSDHNLSDEEADAIRQAMAGPSVMSA
jgi:type II secretory pathway component PulM